MIGRYQFPQDDPGQEPSGIERSPHRFIPTPNIIRYAPSKENPEYLNDEAYWSDKPPSPATRNRAVSGVDDLEEYYADPQEAADLESGRVIPRPRKTPGQFSNPAYENQIKDEIRFDPADTNRDGVVDEIERWMAHQRMGPEEIKRDWIEQNVWKRGLTVDEVTGEIVDPHSGQVVGRMPQFTD